jgi:hypothetical protein
LRNVSEGGAMIEGLWNMPAGSVVKVIFSARKSVSAVVRWSRENRIGVAFDQPLERSNDGAFKVLRT